MGNLFCPPVGGTAPHSPQSRSEPSIQEYITAEDAKKIEKLYSTTALSATAMKFESPEERLSNITKLCRSPTLALVMCRSGVLATYSTFLEFVVKCTRVNSSSSLKTLWDMIDSPDKHSVLLRVIVEVYALDEKSSCESFILRTVKAIQSATNEYEMTYSAFAVYVENYAPRLPTALESVVKEFCFGLSVMGTPLDRFSCPKFGGQGSAIVNNVDLLSLAFFSPNMEGEWTRLYTTIEDGLSFNRIVHHILGYAVSSI
jgi:hypothetical protein